MYNISLRMCQSQPTYRSTFINPVIVGVSILNASSLVSYLQYWVDSAPVVRLDWLLVNVNKDCHVAIDHLSDPDCVYISFHFLYECKLINTNIVVLIVLKLY